MKRFLFCVAMAMACGGCERSWTEKPGGYFESRAKGTTYVYGSVDTMQKVAAGGEVETTTRYYPNGNTVIFERRGSETLIADYEKQHK